MFLNSIYNKEDVYYKVYIDSYPKIEWYPGTHYQQKPNIFKNKEYKVIIKIILQHKTQNIFRI